MLLLTRFYAPQITGSSPPFTPVLPTNCAEEPGILTLQFPRTIAFIAFLAINLSIAIALIAISLFRLSLVTGDCFKRISHINTALFQLGFTNWT